MSLVLTEKYGSLDSWIWKFYLNRYSRLMPTYLLVLLLSAAMVSKHLYLMPSDSWQNVIFKFSTLTLIGIDLTSFYNVSSATYTAQSQLPIPQAWSLGIELWFYLLAPLIVMASTRMLIATLLTVLIARLIVAGFRVDEIWLQRLWPLELYFFLLGILSHRFYLVSDLRHNAASYGAESAMAFAAIVGVAAFAGWFDGMQAWKHNDVLLVTGGLAALLPLIFALTRDSSVDRWIGEFSYPVYIVHMLVMNIVPGAHSGVWTLMALCLVCSVPLIIFVEIPVDRWRQRFFRSQFKTPALMHSSS